MPINIMVLSKCVVNTWGRSINMFVRDKLGNVLKKELGDHFRSSSPPVLLF